MRRVNKPPIDSTDKTNSNLLCRTKQEVGIPCKSGVFNFIEFAGAKTGARVSAEKVIRYKKPKLYATGTKWYVEYYYLVPEELREQHNGKLWIRKKVYEEINQRKSLPYAQLLRDAVEEALKDGYNPFKQEQRFLSEEQEEDPREKHWTIQQAVLFFVQKWRERGLEQRSVERYVNLTKAFLAWLTEMGLQHERANDILKKHIEIYLYQRKKERDWSNRSFNNQLTYLSTVFNFLDRNDIIHKNPCLAIEKLKFFTKKHRYYDEKTLVLIKETMAKDDPYLFFACEMVYGLCIRSEKELSLLRVCDIFPDRNQVFVPARSSKTKTDRYITVAPELMQRFRDRKILDYPKDYFVFGVPHQNRFMRDGTPGPEPFGRGFFSKRFARIRTKLGLSEDFTIYGFKHTRIVHMKLDGATDAEIMSVTGHTDSASFNKYLRDLGVEVNVGNINRLTRKF